MSTNDQLWVGTMFSGWVPCLVGLNQCCLIRLFLKTSGPNFDYLKKIRSSFGASLSLVFPFKKLTI